MKLTITGKEQFLMLGCNDLPTAGKISAADRRKSDRFHDLFAAGGMFEGAPLAKDDEEIEVELSDRDASFAASRIQEFRFHEDVTARASRVCRAVAERLPKSESKSLELAEDVEG